MRLGQIPVAENNGGIGIMKIEEWIRMLSDEYSVQHIDELDGVVVAPLNDEYYLVKTVEVKA